MLLGRCTTVESQDTLVWRKVWSYYKSTFISESSNRILGNISNNSFPAPSPKQPSRSKACTLLCLLLGSLGNPSPGTIYLASLLPRMVITVYLWSWTNFTRWIYWWPVRRVSQHRTLPNYSFNECGCIFGYRNTIISYWDNMFLSTFWSSLQTLLDTKLTNSTTFHP